MIEPARGWPDHLLYRRRAAAGSRRLTKAGRRDFLRRLTILRHHGLTFHARDGGPLRLHVVENSLEILGRVGGVGVRTRFGVFRLTIPGALPDALVRRCVGL